MNPEAKQQEHLLMHYFRELMHDFPTGKVTGSESPDFILSRTARNRTGIELTYLSTTADNPDPFNSHELLEHRMRFIENARQLFSGTSSHKLYVKFLFSEMRHVEAAREIPASAMAVNAIRDAVRFQKPAGFFYKAIHSLPELPEIERILVINHPVLMTNVWKPANMHKMNDDVVTGILETIKKKEEKLMLYRKKNIDACWLIIVVDFLFSSKGPNLFNRIMNHDFSSDFQKVFLFDLMNSKILDLVWYP